jgi:polyphosphate kinase 2
MKNEIEVKDVKAEGEESEEEGKGARRTRRADAEGAEKSVERKRGKGGKKGKKGAAGGGRMKRKAYEKELVKLQAKLCHLQEWVKHSGQRVIIVFEGRDAAGKGGTIKAITERVSPRVFRLVALPAPSDREKSQMYLQRYLTHFPAAGEIVIFDRSWYNRAGVERVMGFCTKEQYEGFLENCPQLEWYITTGGIQLIKVWLEVSDEEQARRFEARIDDPLRQWKLSPMDLPSRERWFDYSRARDRMLEATDTKHAPWFLVRSDDKRRARLNIIAHILDQIPHKKLKRAKIELPKRSKKGAYDDKKTIARRRFIAETY